MARKKDYGWDNGELGKPSTWNEAQVAVLMDIRDELKRLNSSLHCSNFEAVPSVLKKIERRLAKKIKLR